MQPAAPSQLRGGLPGLRYFLEKLGIPGYIHSSEVQLAADQIGVDAAALTPFEEGHVVKVGRVELRGALAVRGQAVHTRSQERVLTACARLTLSRARRGAVLHTPGHSPGSVVLIVSVNGAEKFVLTADTLFPGR